MTNSRMNARCTIAMLASLGAVLGILAVAGAKPGDEPPAGATANELPSVDDVLKRHIDAVGGEEAIQRHSHRTRTGTVKIPDIEIEGKIRILGSAPNLFLMESDLGEHGVNRTGYDGSIGWTIDEINGPALLHEARLAELVRQADFHADMNFRRHYESIEMLGVSKFHEMETYELKMVDASKKDVFAYFCIDSGLHVGLKGMMESHAGPIPTETIIADYESFDGIRLPTRYETHFRDIVQHIRIEEVHHELIDKDTFAVPPAVAELQDEQPEKDREPQSEERVQGDETVTR